MSFWWIALAVGIAGLLLVLFHVSATPTAPLNASGYTYPSTGGA